MEVSVSEGGSVCPPNKTPFPTGLKIKGYYVVSLYCHLIQLIFADFFVQEDNTAATHAHCLHCEDGVAIYLLRGNTPICKLGLLYNLYIYSQRIQSTRCTLQPNHYVRLEL